LEAEPLEAASSVAAGSNAGPNPQEQKKTMDGLLELEKCVAQKGEDRKSATEDQATTVTHLYTLSTVPVGSSTRESALWRMRAYEDLNLPIRTMNSQRVSDYTESLKNFLSKLVANRQKEDFPEIDSILQRGKAIQDCVELARTVTKTETKADCT